MSVLYKVKKIQSGITAPKGFTANGINCGVKKNKLDLGVIYSERPCICAGTFTKNIFKSPAVKFSLQNIKNKIQAVVINSGIANACTGKQGYKDAVKTAQIISGLLNIHQKNILAFSTGVIGQFLNMEKICTGLKKLVPILSKKGHDNVAKAIMTTDTVKKEVAVEFTINDKKIKLGSMAKGSGMIAPDMATMLAFITSDINIDKEVLNKIFKDIVYRTFNRITIDGDTSTSDSVVILCNGMADNKLITVKDKNGIKIFSANLYYLMDELVKKLVKDGEGATKFIKVNVLNSRNEKEALKIGFKIANSLLVKTAIYGSDANWGRIVAAAGSAGVSFDPDRVEVKLGRYILFRNGMPVKFSEKLLKKYLNQSEIELYFNVNTGKENIIIYTSDLTEEYIRINAHYRS